MRDDDYPHVTLSESPPPPTPPLLCLRYPYLFPPPPLLRYPNLFRFEINNESMNVVYIPVFRLN